MSEMNLKQLMSNANTEVLDGRNFRIALSPFPLDQEDDRLWVKYMVFEFIEGFWEEILHPTSKQKILTDIGYSA